MRPISIEARDLPDAWFQAIDACYQHGRDYTIEEGSYAGQRRRELDYVTIHVTHPHVEPLLPELPEHMIAAGIPNPVPTGMDYVYEYLPYLMTDGRTKGEAYTYGERLFRPPLYDNRHHGAFLLPESLAAKRLGPGGLMDLGSQVEAVVAKFKRGFGNNQCTMTIAAKGDIHLKDPPCLRQIDCRIYPPDQGFVDHSKLHFCIYFRSWDLWGGFPPNLAAVVTLQQMMAEEIGVEPGELIAASKGLHLYDHCWKLAQLRLGEEKR